MAVVALQRVAAAVIKLRGRMYFQSIDDKQECIGIYTDGCLLFEDFNLDGFSRTWKYSKLIENNKNIECASFYAKNDDIFKVCPDSIKHEYGEVLTKMRSFIKSLKIAKVDLTENCIFDLIPHKSLKDYLDVKNKITEYVFDTCERPKNYEHLLKIAKLAEEIKYQKININSSELKKASYKQKVRRFIKNKDKFDPYVRYKLFGTKTGRLSAQNRSFPILTLDKDLRNYIEPSNDVFLELDFNAAEIRTLLALNNQEQPDIDIHEWHAQNIFRGFTTRDKAKRRVFAWLYNLNSNDYLLDRFYDRAALKDKFWDGEKIVTPFHREIYSDEFHNVNYVLQSTSNDIFLEQAYKIYELLNNKRSNIAFLLHDSVVIDFAKEDYKKIYELAEVFQGTRFGKFKINVNIGNNFGDMRSFNWKS